MKSNDEFPVEFDQLASRLRSERPEPTAEGLERVRRRVSAGPAPRRGAVLAVGACLGLGVALTGTGTGLAVSGLASDGVSVRAQYPTVGTTTEAGAAAGSGGSQGGTTQPTLGGPKESADSTAGALGDAESSEPAGGVQGTASAGDQPARRLEADSRSDGLPFTGYAAIFTLVLGAGLTTAGVVLRRRLDASEPVHS